MYLVLQCFTVLMGPEVKRCAIWAGVPFHTASLNDPSPTLPLFSQRWSINACVSLSFQDALSCCELAMRREVTNWAPRAVKDTAEFKSLCCLKREWYPSILSVLMNNLEALNIQTPAPGSHSNFSSWHAHAQNVIHTGWHSTSELALIIIHHISKYHKATLILGTMMKLWTNTVHADEKVSITQAIEFYDNYKKLLVFVLEMGVM